MCGRSICRIDTTPECRVIVVECGRCRIANTAIFNGLIEHVFESFPNANNSPFHFARETVAIVRVADIQHRHGDAHPGGAIANGLAETPFAIVDGQCQRHMQFK